MILATRHRTARIFKRTSAACGGVERIVKMKPYQYRFNIKQCQLIASYAQRVCNGWTDEACIFEIGSRDAADAFLLSSLLEHRPRIMAFDPHHRFIELAGPFAAANDRITLENIAIGATTGEVEFYATDTIEVQDLCDDHGIGSSSMKKPVTNVPGLPTVGFHEYRVPCIRGEDFCRSRNVYPKILILDVQGAELEVLRSFGEFLRSVDLIFSEFNIRPDQIYQSDTCAGVLFRFLESNGFSLAKCYGISCYSGDAVFVNTRHGRRTLCSLYARMKLSAVSTMRRAYSTVRSIITGYHLNAQAR